VNESEKQTKADTGKEVLVNSHPDMVASLPESGSTKTNESMSGREAASKPYMNMEYLNMSRDDIREVDANEAEVVSRQLLSRMREITMTVRPDSMSFNNTCITAFENVVYVHFLMDKKKKLLYVKPVEQYDKDAQRWCVIKNGARKSRKITGKPYADRVYRLMGWSKGYYYRVTGAPAVQIGQEDEYLMVFELSEYDELLLTEKARHSAGVEDEELGDSLERIQSEVRAMEEDKKNKVKRRRNRITVDDDAFGVPLKDHRNRVVIPPLDQISMDLELLTNTDNED